MSVVAASPAAVAALARAALAEDVGDGDRTSEWTVPDTATGRATIVARAEGVIAGTAFADAVFEAVDPSLLRSWEAEDGATVADGSTVGRIEGRLRAILAAERSALNGLARLSGIATLASRYVAAVAGTGARILDTRKTTPGWRALEKGAAAAGGAVNHRMGLYDMVLIKENHIRGAGGIDAALDSATARARSAGLEVEIEVTTLEELERALAHGPDRILLDNMDPAALETAVGLARARPGPRPALEASGGVSLETVRRVAETGVDFVSVGAITHSAPALDLSLLVDP